MMYNNYPSTRIEWAENLLPIVCEILPDLIPIFKNDIYKAR